MFVILLPAVLAGCGTTAGPQRLGTRLNAPSITDDGQPEKAAFYIQALRGGLIARLPDLKISRSDQGRALEAEYRALETSPSGQKVIWDGDRGTHGEVQAATPYQVGSQNCRQYVHSISIRGASPLTARGAACRNGNGSWTPLT